MTPFQALYDRSPPTITGFISGSTSIQSLKEMLQQRQEITNRLKQNLQRTRKQMETQENKKQRDYTFNTLDLVLLRLQPYRQSTVNRRTSRN